MNQYSNKKQKELVENSLSVSQDSQRLDQKAHLSNIITT